VVPKVLILGHSFVKRLSRDLKSGFDSRCELQFDLSGTSSVYMHSIGGRIVSQLGNNDLDYVTSIAPDILILEIGTNDMFHRSSPQSNGSRLEDLGFTRRVVR
jgi:hypothetical protein